MPNGLTLVVAPLHRLPLVSVVATVDAGAASDPEGQEGLAVLTARALTEGTASMDAVALVERVEGLGAALDSGADWDAAVVSLTALAPKLGDAFEVLADVLQRPAFPEREVERLVWVSATGVVRHANGDLAQYLDHTFRCRWVSGDPAPGDDEATEAGWFALDALPGMTQRFRDRIAVAVDNPPDVRLGP